MIVSHAHKFIFMKTKKTAGTSVELALGPYCGPDDIITPTDPNEEVDALRGEFKPRNFQRSGAVTWPTRLHERWFRPGKIDRTDFYHHMSAERAKSYLGPAIWNSYYKFTIERNPWDRQISYYSYLKSFKPSVQRMSFSEFLRSKSGNVKNSPIYMIDGKLAVDAVLSFETIADDFRSIALRFGLEGASLPVSNVTSGKIKKRYQDFYTPEDRDYVSQLYAREISLLGYEFESGVRSKAMI